MKKRETGVKYQRADGKFGVYQPSLTLTDLGKLETFLDASAGVVPLRDVARGNDTPGLVAMRHDVDHNLDHAVAFAEWEAERGYRASFYVLHTAWYYPDTDALARGLDRIVDLGHEVGLHSNATVLAASALGPRERWNTPAESLSTEVVDGIANIIDSELEHLRSLGIEIIGVAAHGDIRCYEMGVYNDLRFTKLPLDVFGLEYDADRLARGSRKMGDNHGKIRGSLLTQEMERQTFALLHPCHWQLPVRVEA